jgi:hypothetical protein
MHKTRGHRPHFRSGTFSQKSGMVVSGLRKTSATYEKNARSNPATPGSETRKSVFDEDLRESVNFAVLLGFREISATVSRQRYQSLLRALLLWRTLTLSPSSEGLSVDIRSTISICSM